MRIRFRIPFSTLMRIRFLFFYYLMRMQIQVTKMMWIHWDPNLDVDLDAQHCACYNGYLSDGSLSHIEERTVPYSHNRNQTKRLQSHQIYFAQPKPSVLDLNLLDLNLDAQNVCN